MVLYWVMISAKFNRHIKLKKALFTNQTRSSSAKITIFIVTHDHFESTMIK